ncbi:hypothetical protein F5Y00DRAFT_243779 [Daldinia vernicosa]|uniref:uncharacterized protein n=1 Tax=Daldinia vernicosa TaxID=114800 RepID=UPI002008330A|nr:uncharacterized protein F5Y00DRAFT_243779 [Daldinia vernicosa]KAI0846508.1 hypothetical protein F5Y00DRAFT_243779 [Daldinia vernicosa]
MPDQAEIRPGRRNREGCSIQGRHGQPTQADTSMTPAINGRGQLTVDTSIQDALEREIVLDSTDYSSDEHKLPSEQMHEPDNHGALHGGDSERLVHDRHPHLACSSFTQAFSIQQPANGSNYAISEGINIDTEKQPEGIEIHRPTPTCINLEQYLAQQQVVGNHALESWEAETLYDGPLRLIPQLANPGDWLLQVRADNDHYRESDLETVRDETRNGIYD